MRLCSSREIGMSRDRFVFRVGDPLFQLLGKGNLADEVNGIRTGV